MVSFIVCLVLAAAIVFGIIGSIVAKFWTGDANSKLPFAVYFYSLKNHWKFLLILWLIVTIVIFVLNMNFHWF